MPPQVLKVKILEEGEARKEQRQERDSEVLYGKCQSKYVSGRPTFFEQSKTKFPFKCHMCQEVSHKAKCCPENQIEYKQKSSVAEEEKINVFSEDNNCFLSLTSNSKSCLESGCTFHMTNQYEKFVSCQPDVKRNINLANGLCMKTQQFILLGPTLV